VRLVGPRLFLGVEADLILEAAAAAAVHRDTQQSLFIRRVLRRQLLQPPHVRPNISKFSSLTCSCFHSRIEPKIFIYGT
jgi:hypothetical protein